MEKKRTYEDVLDDERKIQYQLDDFYDEKRRFNQYKDGVLADYSEAISHVQTIVDYYPLSATSELEYMDLLGDLRAIHYEKLDSLEMREEAYKKQERRLEDRLDELYFEKRKLFWEEEERREKESRRFKW